MDVQTDSAGRAGFRQVGEECEEDDAVDCWTEDRGDQESPEVPHDLGHRLLAH